MARRAFKFNDKLVKLVVQVALPVAAGLLIFVLTFSYLSNKNRQTKVQNDLARLFKSGDAVNAYESAVGVLENSPMDFAALIVRGFSAFEIALGQINTVDQLKYIDDCIFSLRKALLTKDGKNDGRVFYVLGKAYYYRGDSYADECVTYLEKAEEANFSADDIPEYLGLSYAALGDYEKSVDAFLRALKNTEGGDKLNDDIYIALSRSYVRQKNYSQAESYLSKCLSQTRDIESVINARLLLGEILEARNEWARAETEYKAILKEGGETARVHHRLGELYYLQGNVAGARFEWRTALRLDSSYLPAMERLGF
jgi:tetratricopeptide (TPR) repeat protein